MVRRATSVVQTADRLHSAAIHLLRRVRRRGVATGVGPAQLSALSVLVFGGERTLGELAAAEGVRPPTMHHIVRGLEAQGLVRRAGDPADRRVVRLRATAKGTRILWRGRRARVADLAARLRGLDAAEVATLRQAAALIERAVRD